METYNPKTDCCPPFDPAPWDQKTFEWQDKKFIKGTVRCAFNVPLNFGQVIKRLNRLMDAAGAKSAEWMGLSDHTSKFSMDVYVSVDKDVPGAENVTLSGKYLSKVYEGDFRETGKWCEDFKKFAEQQGYNGIKKWYMWYTTCPKCAKKYGKNYVVVIGRVG